MPNPNKEVKMSSQVKVGTIATVKVGRNEVTVEIIAVTEHGWRVKSQSSGKEFEAKKLERIVSEPVEATSEPAAPKGKPEKNLSLLNAAAQILETESPLNAKELVAKAAELGLWIPTAAKTPEQSLYSAIFREITGKETPRFRKSETRKGSFELAK